MSSKAVTCLVIEKSVCRLQSTDRNLILEFQPTLVYISKLYL